MSITTRSPFGELETLRDRMDRLFADLSIWSRPATETTGLQVDLRETDTDLILETPLPGIKPEDIDIEVSHGVLTIKGETKEEAERAEGTWHLKERRYGSFFRSITLPAPVAEDKAQATFTDGVLTVSLPKTDQEVKHKIEVKAPETVH
ncbi:MAG TPA: Hsp20/alpha crystallin family protein [Thermomicrobiales bacterium]|nr:Hsp20/alpha crystallin family protein [Thermomicrobiales bacterium]